VKETYESIYVDKIMELYKEFQTEYNEKEFVEQYKEDEEQEIY